MESSQGQRLCSDINSNSYIFASKATCAVLYLGMYILFRRLDMAVNQG